MASVHAEDARLRSRPLLAPPDVDVMGTGVDFDRLDRAATVLVGRLVLICVVPRGESCDLGSLLVSVLLLLG